MKSQLKILLFSTVVLTGLYIGGGNAVVHAATTSESSSSLVSESSSDTSSNESNSSSEVSSSESTSSSSESETKESSDLYNHDHMATSSVIKKGDKITFIVDYEFPNTSSEFKKLVLTDPLETPFRFDSAKVFTTDEKGEKLKDITDLGKTVLDKGSNVLTFTFTNPNNYWGQKVRWQIETTLDKNADISKYMNSEGKIEIPNVASYDTGNDSKTSKPVTVNPPKDPVKTPDKADPLPETGRSNIEHVGLIATAFIAVAAGLSWLGFKLYKRG